MKLRIWLFALVLLSGCATQPQSSGASAPLADRSIGSGTTISLPASWNLQSYPMPYPGAVNYRIRLKETVVAITGIPSEKRISNEDLNRMGEQGSAQYASKSKEGNAQRISLADQDRDGSYVSFTSKSGKPEFAVLSGFMHSAVTSAVVGSHGVVYSISIATNNPEGNEYKSAVAALSSIR